MSENINKEINNQVWDAAGQYQPKFKVDTEAGLNRFKARIAEENKGAEVIPMRRTWLRAAAACLILAVSAYAINGMFYPSQDWVAVNATESKQLVTLPDGSEVYLNEGAELSYINEFEGNTRALKLKGEAFFDVERNPEKPFIIETQGGSVTVLGTSFNINTSTAETEVSVKSGKVAFQAVNEAEPVYLTKNQKALYSKATKVVETSKSSSLNETAWLTGVLKFRGIALQDILTELEGAYGQKIVLNNAALASCPFTDKIEYQEETIQEALSVIVGYTGLELNEKEGVIELTGGKSTCK